MPSETECLLAEWYDQGDGNQQYAGRVDFKAIEEPRRLVHMYAIETVKAHHDSRREDALRALEALEAANLDVMSRLRRLVSVQPA